MICDASRSLKSQENAHVLSQRVAGPIYCRPKISTVSICGFSGEVGRSRGKVG